MSSTLRLDRVSIVLQRPRFPENIGSVARAMSNMGLSQLVVVAAENCDLTRVCRLATHAALEVVEQIAYPPSLQEALKPFQYVIGTTARLGGERRMTATPRQMAHQLIPISQENRIAIVFGPEDRGLTNQELRLCHSLVTIPTACFASLNLAQAVMVICYELLSATLPVSKTATP